MKSKILKKARVASAVMLATATMAAGTANADSLLAPLVISDGVNGIQTFFHMKMRGDATANSQMGVVSPIHYTFLRRADITQPAGLFTNNECEIENTTGFGSPWDIVFQDANGNNVIPDASRPAGYPAALPFYGMWVIDDVQALNAPIFAGEGDFSGFAYIVDFGAGEVYDYKLLNNHRSTASGDFSTGFISKTSIDHVFMPQVPPTPLLSDATAPPAPTLAASGTIWYTAVTGRGMTAAAELDGVWDQRVNITQVDQAGAQSVLPIFQVDPALAPGPGVYNNDEVVISGRQDTPVECLRMYTSEDILTPSQVISTPFGGWKRSHIDVTTAATANGAQATGAFTYRLDNAAAIGLTPSYTMQVETSGHLNTGALGAHPNRPY